MRLRNLCLSVLCALCVWWGVAATAEASHFEGGDIVYENLGPLGGTGANATWIHIRATLTIRQRGSAHCASPVSAVSGGAASVAPHNTTCCNGSSAPSGCKGLWRSGLNSTFTWGAGGVPHPTLSAITVPYQPSGQTADSFTIVNMLTIDEFTQEDSLVFQLVLHRLYPPTTNQISIKWGSCCWISGAQGADLSGNFELTTIAQVASGNLDPVFNSPIRINGCVGQNFTHNLNPSDPDRDPFRVRLIATVGGADQQVPPLTVTSAGVVNWLSPKAGFWVVRVIAEDLLANGTSLKGASTYRDFLLNISATCANRPPVVALVPDNVTVKPGVPACTNVTITDPDTAQKLTARINPTKPSGVVITPITALNPNQNNPLVFQYCWTPAPADEGTTHNIQITATDTGTPALSGQNTFKVTVGTGSVPTITLIPANVNITVDEEKCVKFKAVAADADGPIKDFTVKAPAFCSATRISLVEFEIECCPKYDDDGDHANGSKTYDIEFEVKDNDANQKSAKTTVKLKVNDVNRPPTVTPPGDQPIDENKPFKLTVKAVDPDGDTPSYTMTGLPAGAKIDPATGEITWSPTPQDIGDHTATVTVTDGKGGKTEITIKFTVRDVNDPPVITSTPPKVAYVGEDIGYTATATDPDKNDKLTWSLKKGPAGATIDPNTGKLTWTPDKADAGKDVDVEIEVCDDGTPQACTTQSFKVRVELKCKVDEDCPTTQICVTSLAGPRICVDPGCADKNPKCQSATAFCKAGQCDNNPCDTKTCGAGEYCNPNTGTCIKPCAGVTCQGDEKCFDGVCVKDPCATAGATGGPCAADEVCDDKTDPQKPACVKNPCDAQSCRHGRLCLEDACIDDPCANIQCPDPNKQRCLAGQCIDRKPCGVDIDCDGDQVCLNKQCFPPACYTKTPKCPNAGEQCLGATCKVDECASGAKKCQTGEICRPFDNKCIKSCAAVSCKSGETCVDGTCVKDPCDGVNCAAGEVCIPDSTGTGKCEKDNCNASNVCRHGRVCVGSQNTCNDDLCAGLTCPDKSQCVEGQCQPPPQCKFDSDCPGEWLCVGGKCINPTCKDSTTCQAGQICENGTCKDDPCKDKKCEGGQVCKGGTCVDTCAGVFCPTGEKCINGTCTKDPCAGIKCDAGKVCQNGTCVENPCEKEKDPCKQGRLCSVDKCIDDPCNSVTCPAGQTCKDGQCTGDKDCKTDSDCPAGGVCIDGKCAAPSCYKDQCEGAKICLKAQCGDNACDTKTCGDGEYCKPADGTCAKVCPTCKDGERCKDGRCETNPCAGLSCDTGKSCVEGNCVDDICSEADANTKFCRYGRACVANACADDPCANVKCKDGETCKAGVCTGPPVQDEVTAEPAPEPVVEPIVDAGPVDQPREFSAAGGLGCAGCSTTDSPLSNVFLFLSLMLLLFVGITRRKST